MSRVPPVTAVRAGWGVTLLLFPEAVLALTTPKRPASRARARAVLRVLGARHLVQCAVELRWPVRPVLAAAAAVDGLHSATGLALAALDHTWRRAGVLDAVIAAGFGVGTAALARPRHGPPPRTTGS